MNVFVKQPAESYTIGVEFEGKLPTGVTLSSGTVAAFDPSGSDVSTTVMTGTVLTISGSQARIKVQAGQHGTVYRVRFRVICSNGDVLEEDASMSVENAA